MTDKENHTNSKKYKLSEVSSEENELFYSSSELDKKAGCIGHLRADFGRSGNEFWTSWNNHNPKLNAEPFKTEFDDLINTLRKNSILKDYEAMRKHCINNPQARLGVARDNNYGFKVKTDKYVYYLRCCTMRGDYKLYAYAYDRERLEKYLSPPNLTQKLEENKQKAAKQEKTAVRKNNDLEV